MPRTRETDDTIDLRDPGATDDDGGVVADVADTLIARIVAVGVDGIGPLDSAREVAERARAEHGDVDAAVHALVDQHMKVAAAAGFVTNLGGFVTMAASLPANVVGFYAIATRMSAAIAHLHGHDLDDEAVRAAVLLTLSRDDTGDLLAKAGSVPGASSLPLRLVLKQMPASAIAVVNKGVAFRLLVSAGGKGLARLGRFLPVVGGAVGATIDVFLLRQIAKTARKEFAAPTPAWYRA